MSELTDALSALPDNLNRAITDALTRPPSTPQVDEEMKQEVDNTTSLARMGEQQLNFIRQSTVLLEQVVRLLRTPGRSIFSATGATSLLRDIALVGGGALADYLGTRNALGVLGGGAGGAGVFATPATPPGTGGAGFVPPIRRGQVSVHPLPTTSQLRRLLSSVVSQPVPQTPQTTATGNIGTQTPPAPSGFPPYVETPSGWVTMPTRRTQPMPVTELPAPIAGSVTGVNLPAIPPSVPPQSSGLQAPSSVIPPIPPAPPAPPSVPAAPAPPPPASPQSSGWQTPPSLTPPPPSSVQPPAIPPSVPPPPPIVPPAPPPPAAPPSVPSSPTVPPPPPDPSTAEEMPSANILSLPPPSGMPDLPMAAERPRRESAPQPKDYTGLGYDYEHFVYNFPGGSMLNLGRGRRNRILHREGAGTYIDRRQSKEERQKILDFLSDEPDQQQPRIPPMSDFLGAPNLMAEEEPGRSGSSWNRGGKRIYHDITIQKSLWEKLKQRWQNGPSLRSFFSAENFPEVAKVGQILRSVLTTAGRGIVKAGKSIGGSLKELWEDDAGAFNWTSLAHLGRRIIGTPGTLPVAGGGGQPFQPGTPGTGLLGLFGPVTAGALKQALGVMSGPLGILATVMATLSATVQHLDKSFMVSAKQMAPWNAAISNSLVQYEVGQWARAQRLGLQTQDSVVRALNYRNFVEEQQLASGYSAARVNTESLGSIVWNAAKPGGPGLLNDVGFWRGLSTVTGSATADKIGAGLGSASLPYLLGIAFPPLILPSLLWSGYNFYKGYTSVDKTPTTFTQAWVEGALWAVGQPLLPSLRW